LPSKIKFYFMQKMKLALSYNKKKINVQYLLPKIDFLF
jgi:hypothetical protein